MGGVVIRKKRFPESKEEALRKDKETKRPFSILIKKEMLIPELFSTTTLPVALSIRADDIDHAMLLSSRTQLISFSK